MKEENSLIIPKKENIIIRFFKWVTNIFKQKEEETWWQEPDITIPKAVRIPEQANETMEIDENSLEYLYQLSDDELEQLEDTYDEQIEEAQNEIARLDNILQIYKDSIKKLQNQVEE